ncbi:MAG: phosphatidate cytidylyltransferase [Nitrospinae bacterium]|nr:phosphatidate cytidylyltransferase [Nitrospinota bacterium]
MTRIISSVVALPILIAVIYFGTTLYFLILLEIAIFIGLYEFYRMLERGGEGCYKWAGIALGILLPIAVFNGSYPYINLLITSSVIIPFVLRIFQGNNPPAPPSFPCSAWERVTTQSVVTRGQGGFSYISNTIFGVLYVSLLMSYMILIRGAEYQGRELIFFILITTWMGDTSAYYGGKGLGKHKLAPLISPKKTVEGAIAGLIGSIIGAVIAKIWFLDLDISHTIISGILIAVFGQLGDLGESLIKRNLQVKDSGGIIPGHGGMLDRVDSLLFSAPVFYYYYNFIAY